MGRDSVEPQTRIHLRIARRENHIHAQLAQQFQIAFQIARIFGQVFLRPELRRVDVNADDDFAAFADRLSRPFHQAQMAIVQIAHRRHEADAHAGALPFFCEPLHRRQWRKRFAWRKSYWRNATTQSNYRRGEFHESPIKKSGARGTCPSEIQKPRGLLHAARAIWKFLPACGEIQRRALRHFMGAGLVDRRVGRDVVLRHDVVREHPGFDFLAADVGEHLAVDLDARA